MDIKEEDPFSDNMDSQNETEFCTVKTEIKSDISFSEHDIKQIKTETATCSNNWEIDGKIEIEENPLISDFGSPNKGKFLPEDPGVKLEKFKSEHEIDNEIEIKSEISFTEHIVKQIKIETATCTNNWDIEVEQKPLISDFGSQNEAKFLPENPVMKLEKFKSEHEIDNEIDIKEEPLWPETDTSSVCDDSQDEDFPPVTSSRLCTQVASDASLHLNKKGFIHKIRRSYKCDICGKGFSLLEDLKKHCLTHERKKPHQCKTCGKSFDRKCILKMHNLIHEGKKPHQCKTCGKSFNRKSTLQTHNLIHEGKKPHKCKTCSKSFTHLSTLKKHKSIHEDKKLHQCKVCDKSFNQKSSLERHNLTHSAKKVYQCKICAKTFTQVSTLKAHDLIHEGKRPFKCKICDKSFNRTYTLNRHNLMHEGKKPHHCKTCDKYFSLLSNLKKHSLIHKRKE